MAGIAPLDKMDSRMQKKIPFGCTLSEVLVIKMLRRLDYGKVIIEMINGVPRRTVAEQSRLIDSNLLAELLTKDDKLKKEVVKLNRKSDGKEEN